MYLHPWIEKLFVAWFPLLKNCRSGFWYFPGVMNWPSFAAVEWTQKNLLQLSPVPWWLQDLEALDPTEARDLRHWSRYSAQATTQIHPAYVPSSIAADLSWTLAQIRTRSHIDVEVLSTEFQSQLRNCLYLKLSDMHHCRLTHVANVVTNYATAAP